MMRAPSVTAGRVRGALGAAAIGGVIALGLASPATASESPEGPDGSEPPEIPEDEITDDLLSDSVREFDPGPSVAGFSTEGSIEELGGGESEDEDVIVLETDILFAAMEWELPSSANSELASLVEEVPEDAAVNVHGHTDSNPVPEQYDFDNQELSENRAQAVADVLAEERPDLELNVEGFGASDPAVEEDEEDPETFAANRRVEIRYGD